jgi:hypothetical protein
LTGAALLVSLAEFIDDGERPKMSVRNDAELKSAADSVAKPEVGPCSEALDEAMVFSTCSRRQKLRILEENRDLFDNDAQDN